MLIGDKIPIDDRYYYSLLLLLQICSIVMCPSITLDTIPYLRVLIEEKVSLFYPTTNIMPKMHYMLHYPSQIYMFGSLINTWTMRQEAKHSSQRGNFKNPPSQLTLISCG